MFIICSINLFFFSDGGNDGVSDFEAMMAKKREDQTRKRKRKDIDIINDNDDIIAQLLADMRNAAEVSLPFNFLTFSFNVNSLLLAHAIKAPLLML